MLRGAMKDHCELKPVKTIIAQRAVTAAAVFSKSRWEQGLTGLTLYCASDAVMLQFAKLLKENQIVST